jgi:hypothetical protein
MWVLLVVALGFHFVSFFTNHTVWGFRRFFSAMKLPREAQLLTRWGEYYGHMAFIRAHTPDDSLIILPPQIREFNRIGNRGLTDYFVFPRQTAHENSPELADYPGPIYRVKLIGFATPGPALSVFRMPAGGYQEQVLDAGFSLLLLRERQAQPEAARKDFLDIRPRLSTTLLAIGKLGLIVFAGVPLVSRVFALRTWPGFFASSFLLGGSFSAILFLLFSFVGLRATEVWQFGTLLLLSSPGGLLFTARRMRDLRGTERVTVPCIFAILLTVFFGFLLLLKGVCTPILDWDACAIWGMKARTIFAFQDLHTIKVWGAWPEYPPLVPILMAQLAVGGEALAKVVFPLFAFCLHAVLYEALATSPLPLWARIVVPNFLLLASLFFEHAYIAYANLALAVYVTWGFVLLARWLYRGQEEACLPAALAFCGVVLARPDGEVYLGYAGILSALWLFFQRRRLSGLWWLVLPIATWSVWKLFYLLFLQDPEAFSLLGVDPQGQLLAKLMMMTTLDWAAVSESAWYFVRYIFMPSYWGALPLLFATLVALKPRQAFRRYPLESLFLLFGMGGLAVLSLYLGAYYWGNEYYYTITFVRLYMVLVPLMYLVLLLELGALVSQQGV